MQLSGRDTGNIRGHSQPSSQLVLDVDYVCFNLKKDDTAGPIVSIGFFFFFFFNFQQYLECIAKPMEYSIHLFQSHRRECTTEIVAFHKKIISDGFALVQFTIFPFLKMILFSNY